MVGKLKRILIEEEHTDDYFYEIYSDGYIKQGGVYKTTTSSAIIKTYISFKKQFTTKNIYPCVTYIPSTTVDNDEAETYAGDLSQAGMTVAAGQITSNNRLKTIRWSVEGY